MRDARRGCVTCTTVGLVRCVAAQGITRTHHHRSGTPHTPSNTAYASPCKGGVGGMRGGRWWGWERNCICYYFLRSIHVLIFGMPNRTSCHCNYRPCRIMTPLPLPLPKRFVLRLPASVPCGLDLVAMRPSSSSFMIAAVIITAVDSFRCHGGSHRWLAQNLAVTH